MSVVLFLIACAFLPSTGLLKLLRLAAFGTAVGFLAYGYPLDAAYAVLAAGLVWLGLILRRMRLGHPALA